MTQVIEKTPTGKIRVRVDGRECEGCPGSLLATRELGIFVNGGEEFVPLPVVSDLATRRLGVVAVGGQFLSLL
ncbi:MAG: hypothetical protein UT53_C0022G0003 [Candidatus Yanofskybacteria bacterium GW2011_GWD2_39_48]|uniref:Uncharacterized protein n=1 Tax=Candidatus Yanofskybacteria bacterium GW2011_GWD2_39_48 TaxID=1619031 RepID=A0A0G0SCE0_9BACT|nr:MAG: hypothetical protein UT53_C0022G0003 [Candidatus Yanofskybacteria bacterium GW2011_GWD2_39_48]